MWVAKGDPRSQIQVVIGSCLVVFLALGLLLLAKTE